MSRLRQALVDYLALRRALGYKLARAGTLLDQFLTFVEQRGELQLRLETMVAWATLPSDPHPNWPAARLSTVRRFAAFVHVSDQTAEVPPPDLLPSRPSRATPYLYSDEDLHALFTASGILRSAHRVATYRTLIGLLAVTGMRVGEALALDRGDLDVAEQILTIRLTKFGKSRELPVHRSTLDALQAYLRRADRPRAAARTSAVLVSTTGTRLLYCNVQWTFQCLVRRAGLVPRSAACRPRLHDLRHRFAVRTLMDAYAHGHDPQARLAILSTYLGHVNPQATYWYLSAAPELLHAAGDRLARHQGGRP